MPELSANLQILLQAVCWRVEQNTALKPAVLSLDDEDSVFMLAKYHNLIPWLWYYLNEYSLGSDNFRKQVAKQMHKENLINQLQTREVVALSSGLAKKGIKHLVFKGVSVQALFYQSFVEQRYCDDIDILIEPQDLLASANVFRERGYVLRESHNIEKLSEFLMEHSAWYRWRDLGWEKTSQGHERLDLHWRIADSFILPVDTQQLLRTSECVSINNENIPCMSFAALFVYVCVHAHLDYFFRLRYMVDVYTALQQEAFDYDEVMQIATELGVKQKVIDAVATVLQFFEGQSNGNEYAQSVLKRYHDFAGFVPRAHPHQQKWTRRDKGQYLLNQIRSRSDNSGWYEPLLARCKYNKTMVSYWPKSIPPSIWYPAACITRLFTKP